LQGFDEVKCYKFMDISMFVADEMLKCNKMKLAHEIVAEDIIEPENVTKFIMENKIVFRDAMKSLESHRELQKVIADKVRIILLNTVCLLVILPTHARRCVLAIYVL
jgi:hypothetical protein